MSFGCFRYSNFSSWSRKFFTSHLLFAWNVQNNNLLVKIFNICKILQYLFKSKNCKKCIKDRKNFWFWSSAQIWRPHRKLLTPTFHYDILKEFVEVFNDQSKVLVKILSEKASQGSLNICTYTNLCALDIICETSMGRHVNAQRDSTSAYVRVVKRYVQYIKVRTQSINFQALNALLLILPKFKDRKRATANPKCC